MSDSAKTTARDTSAGSPQNNVKPIAAEAAAARARIDELVQARRVSLIARYAALAVFLLVFVGSLFTIYANIRSFNVDEFEKEMVTRAERMWPQVSETLVKVFEDVTPAFTQAFSDKFIAAEKEIAQRVDDETKILQANVERSLEKRLEGALKEAGKRQREELLKAFPALANDPDKLERAVNVIQEGFEQWVSTQLTTILHQHVEAILDIKTALDAFKPGKEGMSVHPDALVELWLELVYETIGGDQLLEPAPVAEPPADGAPKKPGKGAKKADN